MIDQLFSFSLRRKKRIIFVFKVGYVGIVGFLGIGSYAIYYSTTSALFYYQAALWCARIAILVYIVTTVPGITRRFGIHHKAIGIIMLFRRYIGITMFLLVLNHFWIVRGIDMFLRGIIIIPPPVFQIFGTLALTCLTPMVLTSNNLSVAKLGKWWGRIHQLTYIIVWFIFLHVALQRISIWSVLIGITAFAQISSHIFSYFKKKETTVLQQ